jgi:hypothetical protein
LGFSCHDYLSFCFEGVIVVVLPVPQTKFVLLLAAKLFRLTFEPNQLAVVLLGYLPQVLRFAGMPVLHSLLVQILGD